MESTVSTKEQEIGSLNDQITSKDQSIAELTKEKQEALSSLESSNGVIASFKKDIELMKQKVASLTEEKETTQQALAKQQEESTKMMNQLCSSFEEQLRATFTSAIEQASTAFKNEYENSVLPNEYHQKMVEENRKLMESEKKFSQLEGRQSISKTLTTNLEHKYM